MLPFFSEIPICELVIFLSESNCLISNKESSARSVGRFQTGDKLWTQVTFSKQTAKKIHRRFRCRIDRDLRHYLDWFAMRHDHAVDRPIGCNRDFIDD